MPGLSLESAGSPKPTGAPAKKMKKEETAKVRHSPNTLACRSAQLTRMIHSHAGIVGVADDTHSGRALDDRTDVGL
jgi:hypothetical protein